MNLNSGQMACVSLKGDIDVSPERFSKACFDPILFSLKERRRGRDGNLLSPFRLIDKLGEGFRDFRQEPNPVFLHQLPEERFSRWGTSETFPKFSQDSNFLFDTEGG